MSSRRASRPSQALPPNLLKSPYYTVDNRVGLDNYQYVFTVNTRWGTFHIKGTTLLRVRVREMEATAKLAEIDTAGTVVDAAGRTALKPLGTAKGLITAPGKTISDTFKGVGNLFGSVNAAMEATDPRKEGIIASVSGGAEARRKIAFDLGVDPYTSFPPLDDELTRLATANAIGGTSVNVGLGFVTGGVGIAISVTSTSQKLREALRDKTAAQLEQTGREFLTAMGIAKSAQDAFYANAYLTPTDKAVIVVVLKTLGNVGGREIYVETAAQANSVEMAFYYRRQSELIAKYNEKVTPVRGFVRAGRAPMIDTGRGTVSLLPVDYLYWSAPLEGLAGGGPRRDVDHRAGQPVSDVAARGARLDRGAEGRRPTGRVSLRLSLDADAGAVGVIAGAEARLVMRADITPARPGESVADDHAMRPGGRSEIAVGLRALVHIHIGLVPLGGCPGRCRQHDARGQGQRDHANPNENAERAHVPAP